MIKLTRVFLKLGILVILMTLLVCPAAAESGDLEINSANFPDANFRSYIASLFDLDNDGYLSKFEQDNVTGIHVSSLNIASLEGIALFPNLVELTCADNQLTALDLSSHAELISLNCSANQLTALDVSHNTELTEIVCDDNNLAALNVSKNTALTRILCANNQLIALDVSKNTALTVLSCENNNLETLDISQNSALRYLSCDNNHLTCLDVSQNPVLTHVSFRDNTRKITISADGTFDISTLPGFDMTRSLY